MKSLKDKAIKIKGRDYVQVKDRILALAEDTKLYSIETEYEYYEERRMWVVKAILSIGEQIFTGHAQEIESDDYKQVNATSALENAETSAVGRACAMAGIGVLDSIASVDEINKATNRVSTNRANYGKISDKQLSFIETLLTKLQTNRVQYEAQIGISLDTLDSAGASKCIEALQARIKESEGNGDPVGV